jgi:hypothetical protein
MDRAELRTLVFEILRKTPHTHFRAVENDVRKASDDYERRDVLLLNEILWDLLRQGVLAPGKNSLNPDLPFIHVTEYGTRCLEDGSILAHDPDLFVERLLDATDGRLPDVVVESCRIGLLTLLDGRSEASLILLAHAAERVLDDLAEALVHHGQVSGRGTKRLEGALAQRGRVPDAVARTIESRKLPNELQEEAERQVAGLAGLIRLARSDAGRPALPRAAHDPALARFILFPDQCRFAYHAIAWLEGASAD